MDLEPGGSSNSEEDEDDDDNEETDRSYWKLARDR